MSKSYSMIHNSFISPMRGSTQGTGGLMGGGAVPHNQNDRTGGRREVSNSPYYAKKRLDVSYFIQIIVVISR